MRKDCQPPSSGATVSKLPACFETKPLVATLLALTLVMLLWNLPPYYQNLLSTTTRPSCSAPETTVSLSNTSSSFTSTSLSDQKYLSSSSSSSSNADPNKRIFQAYGNAAALFVQMGAYRGGPTTFAVVGLASKPIHVFRLPWYKCEWISNNGSSIRAKAYKMLPDWGYGRVYTVVVVNCTFPVNPNQDNAGGRLMLNAYYGESQRKYEKFTALEELPGSYNESKFHPPYQYEYLYCGSSLYGNLSASRFREWMAYHAWFFGPSSHFVFHDAGGVSPEARAALDPWVRAGRATVQDIRGQAEFDGYYYNQFLVVNDCLHRYRYSANWTFYFDVDEYIYLPEGNTLESVLKDFSNYTQFTIEQNPMSSALCFNDSTQDYPRQWGFEKLLFRESRTGIRRDRKYAIQAKNAYATGVHMSENVIGKTLHQTETKIRYYHYHNSIQVQGELCREFLPLSAKNNVTWYNGLPYVYDDNMKKLAGTIKDFERNTIGNVQVYS
uniref:Glycosyltransferase family 92 protein n=1 Tax=Populus davidiana TaxID=266767 RepID=A0A6M2ERI0_9ROSI